MSQRLVFHTPSRSPPKKKAIGGKKNQISARCLFTSGGRRDSPGDAGSTHVRPTRSPGGSSGVPGSPAPSPEVPPPGAPLERRVPEGAVRKEGARGRSIRSPSLGRDLRFHTPVICYSATPVPGTAGFPGCVRRFVDSLTPVARGCCFYFGGHTR